MTALTGKTRQSTYKDLIQVSNSNSGVDATLRKIEDGEGTESALEVSTTTVNVDGTLQIGGVALATFLAGTVERFSGDDSTTQFTLSKAPSSVNLVEIDITGVTQVPDVDFGVSGTTLTFLIEAPPTGTNNIVVRIRG